MTLRLRRELFTWAIFLTKMIASFNSIISKESITVCPFKLLYCYISRTWMSHFHELETGRGNVYDKVLSIGKVPSVSLVIYKAIVNPLTIFSKAFVKQSRELDIDYNHWRAIFQIPFSSLRERKIIYLQFRFLHRMLGYNRLFFKQKERRFVHLL